MMRFWICGCEEGEGERVRKEVKEVRKGSKEGKNTFAGRERRSTPGWYPVDGES
jgi:hypothetical protein